VRHRIARWLAAVVLAAVAWPAGADDLSDQIDTMAPTSALVTTDGEVAFAMDAETPHAVGSAFKLAVLVALERAVNEGVVAWDQVLYLDADHISFPSGLLQELAPGSPLTVHTLAALMIAISDNTATDTLIAFLGRDVVEAVLNQPVLTTREFFQLKADPELAQELGDPASRQAVLDELAQRGLPDIATADSLWNPAVEWTISNATLCGLIEQVSGLDLFNVNPGLADPDQWATVAYKGGAETGVLNLTTYLVAETGSTHCVSLTWNQDEAVDTPTLYAAYAALLASLAE